MANENAKLEDLLWGAAEFLRGQIDASDYKQYVFPLCSLSVCLMYMMMSLKMPKRNGYR